MKEKTPVPKGEPHQAGKGQPHQNMQALTGSKAPSSGITQPHNAKKEALGPNTDR